jgi:hypothetical protein
LRPSLSLTPQTLASVAAAANAHEKNASESVRKRERQLIVKMAEQFDTLSMDVSALTKSVAQVAREVSALSSRVATLNSDRDTALSPIEPAARIPRPDGGLPDIFPRPQPPRVEKSGKTPRRAVQRRALLDDDSEKSEGEGGRTVEEGNATSPTDHPLVQDEGVVDRMA